MQASPTLNIPDDLKNCYAVHLRKSDKINTNPGMVPEYEISPADFYELVSSLKRYLRKLVNAGEYQFFICSEDTSWKNEIQIYWLVMTPSWILYA